MKKIFFTKNTAFVIALVLVFSLVLPGSALAFRASDEYYDYQWALENNGSFYPNNPGSESVRAAAGVDIDMSAAWDAYVASAGRRVTVAIIDTGVDTDNADLADHLWTNDDEIPGNGLDDDGNGYVDDVNGWNFRDGSNVLHISGQDSHGTHCAGTIAAQCNSTGIAGICGCTDNVDIMVLKAFDGATSSGNTSDIADAIKYAQANGASIVNLSLGISKYSSTLYNAISGSTMLFVCASGNSGADSDSAPVYPAAFDLDNIISVTNVRSDGSLSPSSNYGAVSVDLGAPGTDILGYGADGKKYYMTGTSMAAPMVTGVAALVYSHFPTATLSNVKSIILDTVTPMASLSGKTVTGGMLNAAAALNYAFSGVSFSDVPSSAWYYSYVSDLAAKGVVSGYPDGTFRPQKSVTVGEALKLILLAAGYGPQQPTGSHWASGYRDLALREGIASAVKLDNLDAAATRLFIGQTTAKALKLSPDAGQSPYSDVNDPYITALYAAGIMDGTLTGTSRVFRPSDSISRCEVCAVVWRMGQG